MIDLFIDTSSSDVSIACLKDDTLLNSIIRNIPNIIASFKDCSDEEEYRMIAKKVMVHWLQYKLEIKKRVFKYILQLL